ncbi:uncharacterized protein LOC141903979 [Tubulanus polymorphus]|uniref:uncharacterized protein LOC141903979 n=1 Tax=Tubulanus polymorphus TaxID=672921 RepID=UPI003DA5F1CC
MCSTVNSSMPARPGPAYGSRRLLQPLSILQPGIQISTEDIQLSSRSDLVNKHILKKIEEWFESWQPWQRRILLCGLTDKCTVSQLEALRTTIEPINHRDFITSLKKRYPCDSLKFLKKKQKKKKKSHPPGARSLSESSADCSENAENQVDFLPEIAEEDYNLLQEIITIPAEQDEEENATDAGGDNELNQIKSLAREFAGRIIVSAIRHCKDLAEKTSVNEENSEVSNDLMEKSAGNSNDPKINWQSIQEKNTHSTDEVVDKMENLNLAGLLDNDVGSEEILLFAPRPSLPKLKPSLTFADSSHYHRPTQGSSGTKADFFADQKMNKLGGMQREIRSGPVRKPPALQDIMVPIQKCYKHSKWFGNAPRDGKKFEKAQKSKLRNHFQRQMDQITEWMSGWQSHERLSILVEIVKICSTELISFMAQCIRQRLQDRTDINRLQDHTLMEIFTYLDSSDLNNAAQVCKRWKYLCSRDELWMVKCEELGEEEGIPDMNELVEKYGRNTDHSIDWRLAYTELHKLADDRKTSYNQPNILTVDGTTPDGKMQFNRRSLGGGDSVSKKASTPGGSLSASKGRASRNLPTVLKQNRHSTMEIREDEEDEDDEDLSTFMDEYSLVRTDTGMESTRSTRRQYRYRRRYRSSGTATSYGNASSRSMSVRGKLDKMKNETESHESPLSREDKPLLRRRKHEEGETALDIRPELRQAKDLLGKSAPGHFLVWKKGPLESKTPQIQYAGEVKPIHRVRRLQGHMDVVLCIRCDRKRLISGSMDRSVRIWDISSGRSIHKLYGHMGGVRCLEFKGKVLFTGSWDMQIMVWDLVKFNRRMILHGHRGAISCLRFNSNHLVSGSHDKTVRVWCLQSYECINVLSGHKDAITCMELIDGCSVLTGSSDRTLRLTDMFSGECLKLFTGTPEPVLAMIAIGDLIISSNNQGQVYFWNKLSGEIEAAIECHKTAITSLSFSKNRFITGSADSSLKEWDLNTLTCVRYLQGHKGAVKDVQVTDRYIVSCSEDGTIRIWDTDAPPLDPADTTQDDTIPTTIVDKQKVGSSKPFPTPLPPLSSVNK